MQDSLECQEMMFTFKVFDRDLVMSVSSNQR